MASTFIGDLISISSCNMGVGFANPFCALDVNGMIRGSDMLIGTNQSNMHGLYFSGTSGDAGTGTSNPKFTFLMERLYDPANGSNVVSDSSELVLAKFNDTPDRIRYISGTHKFQVYGATRPPPGSGFDADVSLADSNFTNALFIKENGYVGIGTLTPGYHLQVAGAVSCSNVLCKAVAVSSCNSITSQGAYLQWNRTGGNGETWLINQKGIGVGGMRFGSCDTSDTVTEWARFDQNGQLGIGTTSPYSLLHVNGTITTSQIAQNQYFSSGWKYIGTGYGQVITMNNSDGKIYFATTNTTGTADATSTLANIAVFDKDGYWGIGTSAPTTRLHVVGNARIQGNLTVNGTMTTVDTNVATTEQLNITNDGTGPAVTINQTGAQPILRVQDDGITVLEVADGGNVGIGLGTTAPGQRLDVSGSIRASSQLMSTAAYGTAPLLVSSSNLVANLNADQLDGLEAISFMRSDTANTSNLLFTSTNGMGVRFWNTSDNYKIYMSTATDATWGGRVTGDTTSDYNMYFRMGSGNQRGFVFQNGATSNIAGIDGTGNFRAIGNIVSSADVIGVGFLGGTDTATTPTFSWTADSNTGFYRPASDTIGITCGGVETIRSSLTQTRFGLGGELTANANYNFMLLDLNIDSNVLAANRTYRGIYNSIHSKAVKGTYTPYLQGVYNELYNGASDYGDASSGYLIGVNNYLLNQSSNDTLGSVVESMFGVLSHMHQRRLGTTSNVYGVYNRIDRDAGTLVNAYGVYNSIEGTISGSNYGIYSTGESDNYLSGNLGLGVTNPSYKLDVNGSCQIYQSIAGEHAHIVKNTSTSASAYSIIRVGATGTSDLVLFKNNSARTTDGGVHTATIRNDGGALRLHGSGFNGIYIEASTGDVAIGNEAPAYKLHVTGDIYATNDVLAFSDCNYKENILPIHDAINKVSQLQGYTYTWKHDCDQKQHVGLLAQEVEKVLPEAVHQDNEGKKSVAYGNMVGLLIQAMNEQTQLMKKQYLLIDTLLHRVAALESKLAE